MAVCCVVVRWNCWLVVVGGRLSFAVCCLLCDCDACLNVADCLLLIVAGCVVRCVGVCVACCALCVGRWSSFVVCCASVVRNA